MGFQEFFESVDAALQISAGRVLRCSVLQTSLAKQLVFDSYGNEFV